MKVSGNINLLNFNSFGIDVRAARLIEWDRADQLVEIFGDGPGNVDGIGPAGGLITGRWMALGGGNNVLFISDFNGTIMKSAARQIVITGQTPEYVYVRAEAGVDWADFVDWCVGRGLWGAENLAGIPGTVGAAPIQNIGAYGAEVKDIIASVECFCVPPHAQVTAATGANSLAAAAGAAAATTGTEAATAGVAVTIGTAAATAAATATAAESAPDLLAPSPQAASGTPPRPSGSGNFLIIAAEHCDFGYRESVFKRSLKKKVIITAVNFTLCKLPQPNLHYAALAERVAAISSSEKEGTGSIDKPTPKTISRAVIELRNSKLPDPKVAGNAGSFFKNPVVDGTLARRLAALHPGMPLYPADPENGNAGSTGNGTGNTAGATSETASETVPRKIKLSAAWLIEKAGWKGRKSPDGRVGIHPHQALIIINLGGATGHQIVDFASRVQADVREKFGVELTPEVNII